MQTNNWINLLPKLEHNRISLKDSLYRIYILKMQFCSDDKQLIQGWVWLKLLNKFFFDFVLNELVYNKANKWVSPKAFLDLLFIQSFSQITFEQQIVFNLESEPDKCINFNLKNTFKTYRLNHNDFFFLSFLYWKKNTDQVINIYRFIRLSRTVT